MHAPGPYATCTLFTCTQIKICKHQAHVHYVSMQPSPSLRAQRSCALCLNAPQYKFAITKIMCTMVTCTQIKICTKLMCTIFACTRSKFALSSCALCLHAPKSQFASTKFMCTKFAEGHGLRMCPNMLLLNLQGATPHTPLHQVGSQPSFNFKLAL